MKRFSETKRFQEVWYQELTPILKCAFEYLWANCDNAGVWSVNKALAEFQIGGKVDWLKFLEKCKSEVVELDENRWFLCGFVQMQCGVLSENCRPHLTVISLLRSHGLMKEDSLSIDYAKTTCSLQYKEKEEDKEQDKEKDTQPKTKNKAKPESEDEVIEFCKSQGLTADDGSYMWNKWIANGFKNGGSAVKDWKAQIRSWKSGGWMPSQKSGVTPAQPAKKELTEDEKAENRRKYAEKRRAEHDAIVPTEPSILEQLRQATLERLNWGSEVTYVDDDE